VVSLKSINISLEKELGVKGVGKRGIWKYGVHRNIPAIRHSHTYEKSPLILEIMDASPPVPEKGHPFLDRER